MKEEMKLLTTREVAEFLNINEKMVYSLIAEKSLPATKVTGKWLFPKHLVEKWIEKNTINYPEDISVTHPGIIVLAGSNDILLEKTISAFNESYRESLCVFANVGSMGGISLLKKHKCHIAASHLMEGDGKDYNFEFLMQYFSHLPAVINFCRRRQGMIVAKGNPKNIKKVEDLCREEITIINRKKGTGTRLLLEKRLQEKNISPDSIKGYNTSVQSHLEVGLKVLKGEADVGIGIEAVVQLLDLDFIPWLWERFDLIIPREIFFQQRIQSFLGFLMEEKFRECAHSLPGYDLTLTGRMIFPCSHRG